MKRIALFFISIFVGIILFIGVIWKVGVKEVYATIAKFTLVELIVILFFALAQFLVQIWRWQLILKTRGHKISFKKLFIAKLVGFSVSYVTPTVFLGGEPVRAYVLNKETNTKFSEGLASIVIDKILDFSYTIPFIIFGVVYVLIKFTLPLKIIFGLIFALLIVTTFMFLFYVRTYTKKRSFIALVNLLQLHRIKFIERIKGKIIKFEDIIIHFFREHKKIFWYGMVLSLLGGAFAVTQFWLILIFLGVKINLLQMIVIAAIINLIFLLPIPAALGSQETTQALLFSLFAFGAHFGVVFTLISRFVDLLKVGFGIGFLSHFGIKLSQSIAAKSVKTTNNENKEDKEKDTS